MMWFLRLFRAFRDLEAELEQAAARAIESEDRARHAKFHLDEVRAEKDLLASKLEWAIKQTANHEARRNGSSVPFPDVDAPQSVPIEATPYGVHPAAPQRRSLRDVQQEAVAMSRKSAYDRRMALANGDSE